MQLLLRRWILGPITTLHFTSVVVGVGVGCIQVWVEVWCRCVSLPVTQTKLTNNSNVSTLPPPIMQLSTLSACLILMGKGYEEIFGTL